MESLILIACNQSASLVRAPLPHRCCRRKLVFLPRTLNRLIPIPPWNCWTVHLLHIHPVILRSLFFFLFFSLAWAWGPFVRAKGTGMSDRSAGTSAVDPSGFLPDNGWITHFDDRHGAGPSTLGGMGGELTRDGPAMSTSMTSSLANLNSGRSSWSHFLYSSTPAVCSQIFAAAPGFLTGSSPTANFNSLIFRHSRRFLVSLPSAFSC